VPGENLPGVPGVESPGVELVIPSEPDEPVNKETIGVANEDRSEGPPPMDGDETENDKPHPQLSMRSDESDDEDSDDNDDNEDGADDEIPDEEVYHPDNMTPSVQYTYIQRPKRRNNYSHLHVNSVHH
jgi:hypothetical protein